MVNATFSTGLAGCWSFFCLLAWAVDKNKLILTKAFTFSLVFLWLFSLLAVLSLSVLSSYQFSFSTICPKQSNALFLTLLLYRIIVIHLYFFLNFSRCLALSAQLFFDNISFVPLLYWDINNILCWKANWIGHVLKKEKKLSFSGFHRRTDYVIESSRKKKKNAAPWWFEK